MAAKDEHLANKRYSKQRYGRLNPRGSALESMPEADEEEEKDQTIHLLNDQNFQRPTHVKDTSSNILQGRKSSKPPMFNDVKIKIDQKV